MADLNTYLQAAKKANTVEAYAAAIRHYEFEWKGFLPATPENVANYLASYAETLSINTLQLRIAALAKWHVAQGFPDPTKDDLVLNTLKGIRTLHPAKERQARALNFEVLNMVDRWLASAINEADNTGDRPNSLRHRRDRALILLGFWRGFRRDELGQLQAQYVTVTPGSYMECFLPLSKGDRKNVGTTFRAPVLASLCPVEAYLDWTSAAFIEHGPVFRAIDQWGTVSRAGLHRDSMIPILRSAMNAAGVKDADSYSTHSLRRGFANWAAAQNWDLKTIMEYVGWKNVNSAMKYLDAVDPFAGLKDLNPMAQLPLIDEK